jgi:Transglycosylase SLT domain
MFSLRLVACATMFLVLFPSSGSAEPDFNAFEIDVDWQLASLPLPPDLEPIATSAILELASASRALKDRSTYLPAIAQEAAASGVPPALVDAVVRIESRYDPTAVGSIGEIGLMQVRPKTAALLGFQGTSAELAEPRTNLRYGVGYLAKAWRLADGNLCRALMKYRAGHGSDKMSALSIEYCRRARQHLAAVGTEIGTSTGALAQPVIRPRGQDVERKRLTKRTISASKASRPQVRERVRLSRLHEVKGANRAWSKKHRVGALARQKTRLARLVHRTSSQTIHWKLAVPKRWVAYR